MCIACSSNIDYLQVYWICIQLNECEVFCIISLVCHRTLVQTRLTWIWIWIIILRQESS